MAAFFMRGRMAGMSRHKVVVFWIWLFTFGTAALIGGLSPLVFAIVGTSYFVLVPLAVLWCAVPMGMRQLAIRLTAQGKLPGTQPPV